MKREKTKLGKMEMHLLAYAQLREKEIISSGEIAVALDISAEQEWKLLNRMATSGVIIRLKRGIYLLAQLSISNDRLSELKCGISSSKSLIPWIPGLAAKGSVNKEWVMIPLS